eukprot:TRINITY_DN3713_c0_g1_i1.p1 TRINITY_DN3713_c0_g1~~TRINITY_DN3713_c0_g1_i1.p1  ORF type:complete len:178 (-),score=33.91 TRINITY_DN3713_c0_g1_i1:61-594(-)
MHKKVILVTGAPGVGKTTLITKLAGRLQNAHKVQGFITQEVREKGTRTGFSLQSLDGKIKFVLASIHHNPKQVGKYGVYLERLDLHVDLLFHAESPKTIFVIDEIGKMECLSAKFRRKLMETLDGYPVIATVAEKGGTFIESIKQSVPPEQIFSLTTQNREQQLSNILQTFATLVES